MTEDCLLVARGLTRRYGPRAALVGLDLALARGDCLGLLGLNGAGKSTTLKILTGVLAPHAGTVAIGGHDLARTPLAAKRLLGYLPDVPPLFPDARVDEYLALCARLREVREVEAAVGRAKARCGLADVGQRLIRNLSKGYQQRVGLAQAIVHEPALLVLDEPTVGLDPVQIRDVRLLVAALAREHAVILSTHLLAEVQQICTRVAVLHEGRLVHEGPLAGDACWLRLRLRAATQLGRLQAIPGVQQVQPADDGAWLLRVATPAAAEHVAAAVTKENLGLLELRVADSALEQTFLALTVGHRAQAGA
ncbi:MAG: ABC transporter ATP-binding protein [Gammaproteobacteria bacterium]|nr:ABC transporter ATP-binding protein [Gammaproteobacteria bacterium]